MQETSTDGEACRAHGDHEVHPPRQLSIQERSRHTEEHLDCLQVAEALTATRTCHGS